MKNIDCQSEITTKSKRNHKGEKNPFFNKHHSNETKEILRSVDRSYTQTQEFKDKCKKVGKANGMYGKSLYELWIEKYGKEEADNRQKLLCQKRSLNVTGKKNPMFGKPSPIFSGNGFTGWYKNWLFRSIRELSYVINVLEKKKLHWISAEHIRIPYVDHDGRERTYTPDFLVENKILVEIKPKRLKKLWTNKLKKNAAKKFCKQCGYKYQIIDVRRNRLTIDELIDLHKKNLIKLSDRSVKQLSSRIKSKFNKSELKINEEKEMTIKQFFDLCKQGGRYQIDTPDGWQDINFLVKKKNKKCVRIKTKNKQLCCAEDHLVETITGWKKSKDLKTNEDIILTKDGNEILKTIKDIGVKRTYDLQVNSQQNRYYSNGISSHNCGKTRIMEALPNEWGLNYVEFDPSSVYSPRVGESEGNMRMALAIIESLSPCILGIDEIDKGFSGTQSSSFSDAGTTSRTFGIFIIWMNNNLSSVFVAATCNRIETLPPELISRFDEIFYVGPPNVEERADIIKIQIAEQGRDPKKFNTSMLAEACPYLSGREIMQAMKEAMHIAFNVNHSDITDSIIRQCLTKKTPVVKTMERQLESLVKWVGFDEKTKDGIRARFANNEMDEYDQLFREILTNSEKTSNYEAGSSELPQF